MSYSQWLNSYWYTYWQVEPDKTKENRDTAKFCICDLGGDNVVFTAKELRKDMDSCIQLVNERGGYYPLLSDLDELATYMNKFIEDVNEKYPLVL